MEGQKDGGEGEGNQLPRKWDVIDVIKGEYLSKVISFLYRENLFEALPSLSSSETPLLLSGKDARAIAVERGLDPEVFHQLLSFVAGTTDIILCDHRTSPPLFLWNDIAYGRYGNFGHYIDKVGIRFFKNKINSPFIVKKKFAAYTKYASLLYIFFFLFN